MSRFYFNVREGDRFFRDEEGLEFESLDAAEHQAASTAAEIGRDRLPNGDTRDVIVEVRDEQHQRVLSVRVAMEVCRIDPAHA